jgi:hypothetical protein
MSVVLIQDAKNDQKTAQLRVETPWLYNAPMGSNEPMAFLKSFAVGVAALVIYIFVLAAYPFLGMWWQMWQSRQAGSGGIGAVSTGVGLLHLLAGLLIFALAFWWEFRRASH